jgi:subtilisin family serine protease
MMKYGLRISLSTACFAVFLGTSLAASLSEGLRLRMQSSPGSSQRVIVLMKDAPGARRAMAHLDRKAGLLARRQNAALAQKKLLGSLAEYSLDARRIVSNWLINAVLLDATPAQIRALQERADVRRVEVSEALQLDPVIEAEQKGDLADGDSPKRTWGLARIRALEARARFSVDGSGVVVGVLDTGFDASHPLLAGKLLAFKDFASNFSEPIDDHGHGSHVAGTIGGSAGDGLEIGVAPGVKFVVGKIFKGDGGATTEGILGAMQWVVDPDGIPGSGDEPRLVSNSWGGGPGRTVYREAVKAWLELGIAPIFAAGNSGPRTGTVGTPGGYLESLAVGASTLDHQIASFSSRGPVTWDSKEYIKPDVSAPGKNVTSVKAGGGYWTISGTSMACPHVAGVAALLYQARPDLSVGELFQALQGTSVDQGAEGKDNRWGFGEVDVVAALTQVVEGGTVHGQVLAVDGSRVSYAHVFVEETGVEAQVDAEGRFELVLGSGEYHLQAKAFGHAPLTHRAVTVTAGSQVTVQLALVPAAQGRLSGRLRGQGVPVAGKFRVMESPLPALSVDVSGTFTMELPVGSYRGVGSALGFEAATSPSFSIQEGEVTELVLDLEALPPLLVIDGDGDKHYERYFEQALDLPHKRLKQEDLKGLMSGSFLSQYQVVIWFTGNQRRDIFSSQDQLALKSFLDDGGRLLLTGQDLASSIKRTHLLSRSLGVKVVNRSSRTFEVGGEGLSFKILGGDGAKNQRFPDHLDAMPGRRSEVFLRYQGGKGAAVRFHSGKARAILLGFGFEGVSIATTRKALLDHCMAWLRPSEKLYPLR